MHISDGRATRGGPSPDRPQRLRGAQPVRRALGAAAAIAASHQRRVPGRTRRGCSRRWPGSWRARAAACAGRPPTQHASVEVQPAQFAVEITVLRQGDVDRFAQWWPGPQRAPTGRSPTVMGPGLRLAHAVIIPHPRVVCGLLGGISDGGRPARRPVFTIRLRNGHRTAAAVAAPMPSFCAAARSAGVSISQRSPGQTPTVRPLRSRGAYLLSRFRTEGPAETRSRTVQLCRCPVGPARSCAETAPP